MDSVYQNCTVSGFGEVAHRVVMRVESRARVAGPPPRVAWAGRLELPTGEALLGGAEYAVSVGGGLADGLVRVLAARLRAGAGGEPTYHPFVGVGPPPGPTPSADADDD